MLKIQIINGPNLNLLGKREISIYGNISFEDFYKKIAVLYPDYQIDLFQTNIEGEIINKLHETGFSYNGIILNAAAFTHTSIAIADAIAVISTPVIEVHISNIYKRESFRHKSIIAPYCYGCITGFGLDAYILGIESIKLSLEKNKLNK
jgi:3-dehydroquinate dehydratase II